MSKKIKIVRDLGKGVSHKFKTEAIYELLRKEFEVSIIDLQYPETHITYAGPASHASYFGVNQLNIPVGQAQIDGADIVIVDFSPLAIASAKTLGIPVVSIGTGFEQPPPSAFGLAWGNPADDILVESAVEERELEVLNICLASYNLDHTTVFNNQIIACLPDFDPYFSLRSTPVYTKPIFGSTAMVNHSWPTGYRYLVYMGFITNGPFFHVLDKAPEVNIVRYSDSSITGLRDGIQHYNIPLDQKTVEEATAVICYGGNGLISSAIYAGTPLIVAPELDFDYWERRFNRNKVESLGLGVITEWEGEPILSAMNQVITMRANVELYRDNLPSLASWESVLLNKVRSM